MKLDIPGSAPEHDQVCHEILKEISQKPSSQTLLLQTSNFTSEDNKEYWQNEYFHKDNSYAAKLRAKLPVISPLFTNQRKLDFLDVDHNVVIEDYPDYPGKRYRKYFPYNYPTEQADTLQYQHSRNYGPVHFCFPEIEFTSTKANDEGLTFAGTDLASTSKKWKVLSFDISTESLNGKTLNQEATNKIKSYAREHNVQLVIMGSEDYYAHWMDEGIHFMIIGNGGKTTNSIDFWKI